MTKTYIVSEEVLRQVLGSLEDLRELAMEANPHWEHKPHHYSTEALRAILSKEPNEPVAWLSKTNEVVEGFWEEFVGFNRNGDGIPLYRKDA